MYVFVINGAVTLGILVLFGCKYMDLVEMITNELKMDKKRLCLKIEYVSNAEKILIRIVMNKQDICAT